MTYSSRRVLLNFYKVEQWSRDGQRVLAAVSTKARRIFDRITKHRPRIRLDSNYENPQPGDGTG